MSETKYIHRETNEKGITARKLYNVLRETNLVFYIANDNSSTYFIPKSTFVIDGWKLKINKSKDLKI